MSHPILVTGAAGGPQGSTGRRVASLLIEQGVSVRALVHKLDGRSEELGKQGAEVVEGDLLNPAAVQSTLRNVNAHTSPTLLPTGCLRQPQSSPTPLAKGAWSW